jgi:hypothetical protein
VIALGLHEVSTTKGIAKIVTSNEMDIDPDLLSDDLSSAMGAETLVARDIVPENLPTSSKGPAEQQIHQIRGERYLILDQIASSAIPVTKKFDPIT